MEKMKKGERESIQNMKIAI